MSSNDIERDRTEQASPTAYRSPHRVDRALRIHPSVDLLAARRIQLS